MKANDLVAPYLPRRCGEEGDYEGPDFIFKLQHTSLNEFLDLVGSESGREGKMGGRERREGGEEFWAFEYS